MLDIFSEKSGAIQRGDMINIDLLRKTQTETFNKNLEKLDMYCKDYAHVECFVNYILACGNADCYGSQKTFEERMGRELIGFIWQISRVDLSSMANSAHFDLDWSSKLLNFIGNYFLEDSAFSLVPSPRGANAFEFESSDGEGEKWLQNPLILIEAAIANINYYDQFDKVGIQKALIDRSKVKELINGNHRACIANSTL